MQDIVKELDREKLELMNNFNRLTKETNEANFKLCVLEAKLEMEVQENQELRQQLGLPSLPEFPPIETTTALPANAKYCIYFTAILYYFDYERDLQHHSHDLDYRILGL